MACAPSFPAGLGCKHYKRKAKLITPCCKKEYICRLCHDDCEDHVLNRKEVKSLICMVCNTKQNIRRSCSVCRVNFGEYMCLECRLFDKQNGQYHCEDCGICRVGPREAFFHCDKCNLCLNNLLRYKHTCIENVTRDNCSVCMEDMHSSTETLSLLNCGHFLHEKCYKVIKSKENCVCPLCRKELVLNDFHGLALNSPPSNFARTPLGAAPSNNYKKF